MYLVITDICMEFGIRKCGVVILHHGKLNKFEEISFPNVEVMKSVDQEWYKYPSIMKLDTEHGNEGATYHGILQASVKRVEFYTA